MAIDALEIGEIPKTVKYETINSSKLGATDITQLHQLREDLFKKTFAAYERGDPSMAELFEEFQVVKYACQAIEYPQDENGLIVTLAKDEKGNVVGFQTFGIKSDQGQVRHGILSQSDVYGISLFVDPERRRDKAERVGTNLLQSRLSALKTLGIKSYETSAREGAVGLYRNMGLISSTEPLPQNSKGAKVVVSVK